MVVTRDKRSPSLWPLPGGERETRYPLPSGRGQGEGRIQRETDYRQDSKRPAAPWPPPMHIVTTPYFALRRSISLAMVPTIREPVMPKGWPIEIDPPFGLSFSIGMPSLSRQ